MDDSGTTPNTTCPAGQTWDTVAGKCLDKCPPTQARNGAGQCVEVGGGPAGGGGAGGGGGGGGTAPFKPSTAPYKFTPWKPPPQTPFEISLQSQIDDFLKGWKTDVPYTPDVIQNLQTDAFRSSYGREGVNKDAIQADAIRRGVLRSSGTDRRVDASGRSADTAYSNADRGITNTATQANFQAHFNNRTSALDRAQKMLDSQREYLLASETNDFRRQQGMAQLAFSYYGLEQERWSLTQQLNNSNYQFGRTMDWNKLLLQWQILNGITPGQAA